MEPPCSRPARISVQVNGHPCSIPDIDEIVIGRDPTAHVHCDDPRVSRRHAVLARDADGWQFSDIASHNGSFLDGQPLIELHISEPVEIYLGDAHFGSILSLTPVPPTVDAMATSDAMPAVIVSTHGDDGMVSHDTATTASDTDASTSSGGFLLSAQRAEPAHGTPRAATPTPERSAAPAGADDSAPLDSATLLRILGVGAIVVGAVALLNTHELPLPLFLIIGGLILALYIGSPTRLMRDQVVDRWDCLIDGGQERGSDIIASTTARITGQGLPSVSHTQQQLTASALRGDPRPFLVISQRANSRLRPYKMYVNVRDYGTNLQVSWFLIYHRGFFERLKPNPLVALNLFDEQDLRAYSTTVHHALIDGVIELMLALDQDTSTLSRSTKGFLGIS